MQKAGNIKITSRNDLPVTSQTTYNATQDGKNNTIAYATNEHTELLNAFNQLSKKTQAKLLNPLNLESVMSVVNCVKNKVEQKKNNQERPNTQQQSKPQLRTI